MTDQAFQKKLNLAKERLRSARHAAMATVNEDGSPHNTPYFFICEPDLSYLYWGSHPESQHSQNVARTGQIFVVLFDAISRGGVYIEADDVHVTEGEELEAALKAHNVRRIAASKEPLTVDYYSRTSPQRLYRATTKKFWINGPSELDENGLRIRDIRLEVSREDLIDTIGS